MLTTLLTSVGLPILVDFFKSAAPAISRTAFGISAEDQIKLANADIERLKALALLDTPGGSPSQWVVNLRAAFRYLAAAGLIAGGLAIAAYGAYKADQALMGVGFEMAAAPFGFIFGERLVLSFRAVGK